jgi:uncharacterized ParB-like nuclease family protein
LVLAVTVHIPLPWWEGLGEGDILTPISFQGTMTGLLNKIKVVWKQCHIVSEVKCFKENQIKENAFNMKNRGTRIVPLKQVVGSVGRYHDFDRKFRLKHHISLDRFERMKDLMQGGVSLPPVKLYQIKNEYYVLDGNHRVSAAKKLGYKHIEARIVEFLPSKLQIRKKTQTL